MTTTQTHENIQEITTTVHDVNVGSTDMHDAVDAHGEEHAGPHIPLIQGEQVYGAISNTTITSFIFLLIVLAVSITANKALKKNKKSRLKLFCLTFVKFFDDQIRDAFGDKKESRKYFALIVGMFSIIFFGNLFGLVIDWFGMSILPGILLYLRPMHSDLNTTLVLALITVTVMLWIQARSQGTLGTVKSYLWNFTGANVGEKCINVFVGWLHLIGVPVTATSLSLRLFGNIFAGIVLI